MNRVLSFDVTPLMTLTQHEHSVSTSGEDRTSNSSTLQHRQSSDIPEVPRGPGVSNDSQVGGLQRMYRDSNTPQKSLRVALLPPDENLHLESHASLEDGNRMDSESLQIMDPDDVP